jgi:hypothetical protein
MEVITQLRTLPGERSSQVQQFSADRAIIHYNGAQHKELANVGFTIEREAACFINENEFVRHDEKPQIQKSREVARALECDESAENFDGIEKAAAKHAPAKGEQPSKKKDSQE